MPQRTLSTGLTFLMKFIFPPVWICGFGAGTVALFIGGLYGRSGSMPPDWMKWLFLAVWVCGSAFILWSGGRLKRVRTDGSAIYVSNYFTELRIPVEEIKGVSENRWIKGHPVTIQLRTDSAFGSRLVFMPAMRYFKFWSSHPVVAELLQLAHVDDP